MASLTRVRFNERERERERVTRELMKSNFTVEE